MEVPKLQYKDGFSLIYDVKVWKILRTEYRIVGELFGLSGTYPVLPLALCAEEAYMIIKKGIVKLVVFDDYVPTFEDKLIYNKHITKLYEEEKIILRDIRKSQISNMASTIIKGKRKKGQDLTATNILNQELAKLPELKEENMITAIYTRNADTTEVLYRELPAETLLQHTTPTKCTVYEDLWNKRFYVTTARKFGGDYLIYFGDPLVFHAAYIVICIENSTFESNVADIVKFGRLGNSVKKKTVFAKLDSSNVVKYITLTWLDC